MRQSRTERLARRRSRSLIRQRRVLNDAISLDLDHRYLNFLASMPVITLVSLKDTDPQVLHTAISTELETRMKRRARDARMLVQLKTH